MHQIEKMLIRDKRVGWLLVILGIGSAVAAWLVNHYEWIGKDYLIGLAYGTFIPGLTTLIRIWKAKRKPEAM